MKVLGRQMESPWTDIAPCTYMHGRNQPWTHPPLCTGSWIGRIKTPIASVDVPLKVMFHFALCQGVFVVVTLHSADVTNPSVVPQELGISFATFGIQRRASLSLNPFQIISSFHPFLCIPLPFSSSWIPHLPLISPSAYYTPRPWFWKIELRALFWMNYCL